MNADNKKELDYAKSLLDNALKIIDSLRVGEQEKYNTFDEIQRVLSKVQQFKFNAIGLSTIQDDIRNAIDSIKQFDMKPSKFTLEERKIIYEIAYNEHLRSIEKAKLSEDTGVPGMCYDIKTASHMYLNSQFRPIIDPDLPSNLFFTMHFPEFAALKPENKNWGDYWWSQNNYKIRKDKYEKYLLNL